VIKHTTPSCKHQEKVKTERNIIHNLHIITTYKTSFLFILQTQVKYVNRKFDFSNTPKSLEDLCYLWFLANQSTQGNNVFWWSLPHKDGQWWRK